MRKDAIEFLSQEQSRCFLKRSNSKQCKTWIPLFLALLVASFVIGFPLAAFTFAQQPPATWTGPKTRIGVMDLSQSALKIQTSYQPSTTTTTVAIPPPAEFARGLTEMLTTALVNSGKFIVLERTQMQQITGEQDFGASDRVNPATAAAKGQIFGAQALITGDITEFTYEQTSLGGKLSIFQRLGAKSERVTAMVALDIRVLDAVTSEVLFSQRGKGTASMTGVAADLTVGSQEFSASGFMNTPLGKASRQALETAVAGVIANMKKVPWAGRVIDFRSGVVYVNAGKEMGIQPGIEFEVYKPEEPLIDPETQKVLGRPERRIGAIRITKVEDTWSAAEVLEGEGFGRGDSVRMKGQAEKP